MTQTLRMTFLNAAGNRVSISLDNPRDNLTQSEVEAAMNTVITKKVFTTSGGDLVSIDSAAVIDTTTTEIIAGS
ncbi:hypothetical protein Dtox_4011 [Desulfofarcimen acetoxidans DSM 771]|uniref:DUF2922 domain-containing protein n=1 Tax=Desulfofarcimen acetoxidans (strain ATCC 49208 / DSM 771 / KCTC 5769 / VKM B-1644 / 5575) TaxID=485916 RepID=C8VY69_DESAS|nr:DUF2922 domain-containing protein [Desulfofarcimen acetoxidans]ACV64698.1 hypothetical protein Dtox_4011 [Desulfofarcimen acetoxidans DSM 771]